MCTPVNFETENGNVESGFVLKSLNGRDSCFLFVSQSPNYERDAQWVDSCNCWEEEDRLSRNGQCLSQFV